MVERVRLDIADGVACVCLNSPPHNVLDTSMRIALVETAARLADRPDVRAVVIGGGDHVFAAGADQDAVRGMGLEEISNWNLSLQRMLTEVAELRIPMIAAIEGDALGGGLELALCADYRIAGERARFSQHELLVGAVPGPDATTRLAGLVGLTQATELGLTGRRVEVHEALDIGLIGQIVSPGSAMAAGAEFAGRLAAGSVSAIQAITEALDHRLGGPSRAGQTLDRMLRAEWSVHPDLQPPPTDNGKNGSG